VGDRLAVAISSADISGPPMPADDGLRPNDFQWVQRLRCEVAKTGKDQSIDTAKYHSLGRPSLQDFELMTQNRDLGFQRSA